MRPPRHPFSFFAAVALIPVLLASCYNTRPASPGGAAKGGRDLKLSARTWDPSDISLPAGYKIEVAATGLTFPTALAFDDEGALHVVEGGWAYGGARDLPRLLRIQGPGTFVTVATGDTNGPWTGVAFVPGESGKGSGSFYVAEGGAEKGGRILRIGTDGSIEPLVENLPSRGDHHTNGPVLGPDGMLYFGQGTATNSGVVGLDNSAFGWLAKNPRFHDIPCQDIALTGENYETHDPFNMEAKVRTGAFSPFGTPTTPGQIVRGQIPCNGAILRMPRGGGKTELVAWGFRNPFALAFAPDGKLYAIDNGYDERGSRPIWGAGELLWEVKQGSWYGWPDWSGAKTVAHAEFTPPRGERPKLLLQKPPGPWLATQASAAGAPPAADAETPPHPVVVLPVHSSADGLDFSRSEKFGHRGQAFVAEFGDMAPDVGKVLHPVGFKIARVDMQRGIAEDFAVNRKGAGPASRLGTGGLERPVALRFSPDGSALYVVDFGVMTVGKDGPEARKLTGAVWRITREGMK